MIEEALRLIPITHDTFTYLFLIGAFQSFFLSIVVLWNSRLKSQILILLGFFLFLMGSLILDLYLARSGVMRSFLWYNDATEWMVLCLGPVLYLISEALLDKKKITKKKFIIHLLAPFTYLCYQIFYFVQPTAHKFNAYIGAFQPELNFLEYTSNTPADPLLLKHHFERLLLLSIISYAVAGCIKVVRNSRFPGWRNVWSTYDKYTFIIWSFGSLILNGVVLFLLFLLTEEHTSHMYTGVLISSEVFLLTLLILNGSNIFSASWVADKYDTSGINDVSAKEIFKQITRLMKQDQLYLKPKLSIGEVAKSVGVSSNHISLAINAVEGKNFNDFINSYRIRDAIIHLESGRAVELTIESIGTDVGFTSKSAFYQAFKKVTGQTPLSYRHQ